MKSPFTNLKQLFDDLAATLRIRAFRLHLGMYLGGYISQDIFNAVFSYFVVFVFLAARSSIASNIMTLDGVRAADRGGRVHIWLCLRIHAAPSYRIALGLFAVGVIGFATLYRVGVRDLVVVSRRRCWSPASAAARSITFPGASTTTCPTSMRSSRAAGAKARSPAS